MNLRRARRSLLCLQSTYLRFQSLLLYLHANLAVRLQTLRDHGQGDVELVSLVTPRNYGRSAQRQTFAQRRVDTIGDTFE